MFWFNGREEGLRNFSRLKSMLTVASARDKVLWRSRSLPSTAFFHDSGEIRSGKRLKLKSGSCYIPKDKIEKPVGEDAHFINDDKCTIGVADGVGGFAKRGIDSGEYARQLMSNSLMAIQNRFPAGSLVDPKKVLREAYSKTKAEGASTACILTLTDQQRLHAVNVGDSGFIIIRNGHTVYHSPVQQHYFNCPYQLRFGNGQLHCAEVIKMEIEEGDVIVVGTDGLFDNMFDRDIEEIVLRAAFEAATTAEGDGGGALKPEEVAWRIAELAVYNSLDAHSVTPFQVESEKAGEKHQGGKHDDVTVIVSFVQQT